MRLEITVTLDSGGRINMEGENLTAEDIAEVFTMLADHTVESQGEEP